SQWTTEALTNTVGNGQGPIQIASYWPLNQLGVDNDEAGVGFLKHGDHDAGSRHFFIKGREDLVERCNLFGVDCSLSRQSALTSLFGCHHHAFEVLKIKVRHVGAVEASRRRRVDHRDRAYNNGSHSLAHRSSAAISTPPKNMTTIRSLQWAIS
ncbi:MAG: hypothetical protein ACI8XD_001810, partial [Thermoproteota archaeon]